MSTTSGQSSRSVMGTTPRVYPPDLQPLLQSLLAVLADIDLVHESEVTIVRDSDADEWLKRSVIRRLEERHRERRVPVVRQLEAVEERIRALAA
jgi:pyruvate-formate lyase-activating enzyme